MSSTDYLTTLGTWETLRLDLKYAYSTCFCSDKGWSNFIVQQARTGLRDWNKSSWSSSFSGTISEALSCKVQVLYLNEINITCFMQWYNKMLASFDHFSNMFLAVNPYPSMLHRLNIDKGRLPRNNVKPCSTQFTRSTSSPVWFSLYKKDDILIDFCSCA